MTEDDDLKQAVRILARQHNRVFTPEMITALAAIFIGVCALAVSVIEVRVLHSQERASFWPYLLVAIANAGDDPTVSLALSNQGTGPAVKKAAAVAYRGRYYRTWRELLSSIEGAPSRYVTNGLLSAAALPAGEQQAVLQVPRSDEYAAVHEMITELDVTICYCSLLDECWTVRMPGPEVEGSLQDFMPKEGACAIPEEQQFLE